MVHDSISSDSLGKPIYSLRAILLEEIQASADSVSATIRVTPRDQRVDERLATSILALRPQLTQHVCKHRGYGHFGDKLLQTTLPHLIEHVAIDFLVEDERCRAQQQAPDIGQERQRARAGTTTWLDQREGTMRVRVSCFADTAGDTNRVCAAITRAITLVNDLLV